MGFVIRNMFIRTTPALTLNLSILCSPLFFKVIAVLSLFICTIVHLISDGDTSALFLGVIMTISHLTDSECNEINTLLFCEIFLRLWGYDIRQGRIDSCGFTSRESNAVKMWESDVMEQNSTWWNPRTNWVRGQFSLWEKWDFLPSFPAVTRLTCSLSQGAYDFPVCSFAALRELEDSAGQDTRTYHIWMKAYIGEAGTTGSRVGWAGVNMRCLVNFQR